MARETVIFQRTVAEAVRQCRLLFGPGTGHVANNSLPPSATFARQTIAQTTGVLATLATETGSISTPASVQSLLTIAASAGCWVRLYTSSAAQTADAARTRGTLATPGTGVLAEFDFTSIGAATIPCSPVPMLANDEATIVNRIWYAIQNTSGGAAAITVTMNILPLIV